MNEISRRSILASFSSLPFFGIKGQSSNSDGEFRLEDREETMSGITFHAKFWRERRWDIIYRVYDKVSETMPDVDFVKLSNIIKGRMKIDGNKVHYITVAPGNFSYYVHFKYVNSDMSLAVPIV